MMMPTMLTVPPTFLLHNIVVYDALKPFMGPSLIKKEKILSGKSEVFFVFVSLAHIPEVDVK